MENKFLIELGQRIRERRIELGMSLEELGVKSGYVGKSPMSRVERGERNITPERLQAIAKALDVTPVYLMGWEDKDGNDLTNNTIVEMREEITTDKKALLSYAEKLANLPQEKQEIIFKLIEQMGE